MKNKFYLPPKRRCGCASHIAVSNTVSKILLGRKTSSVPGTVCDQEQVLIAPRKREC